MNFRSKSWFLMLVAILFWTAAPAFACLSNSSARPQEDCCTAMPQDCGVAMSASCCQLAPKDNPSTIFSEYAPEFNQQPGMLWHSTFLPSLIDSGTIQNSRQSHCAPDPSPGHLSILRI